MFGLIKRMITPHGFADNYISDFHCNILLAKHFSQCDGNQGVLKVFPIIKVSLCLHLGLQCNYQRKQRLLEQICLVSRKIQVQMINNYDHL